MRNMISLLTDAWLSGIVSEQRSIRRSRKKKEEDDD